MLTYIRSKNLEQNISWIMSEPAEATDISRDTVSSIYFKGRICISFFSVNTNCTTTGW
jgi:hypothetical protein